jgi:hypothetical protein
MCGNIGHIARECGYTPPKDNVKPNQVHTSLSEPVWCKMVEEDVEEQGKEYLQTEVGVWSL